MRKISRKFHFLDLSSPPSGDASQKTAEKTQEVHQQDVPSAVDVPVQLNAAVRTHKRSPPKVGIGLHSNPTRRPEPVVDAPARRARLRRPRLVHQPRLAAQLLCFRQQPLLKAVMPPRVQHAHSRSSQVPLGFRGIILFAKPKRMYKRDGTGSFPTSTAVCRLHIQRIVFH